MKSEQEIKNKLNELIKERAGLIGKSKTTSRRVLNGKIGLLEWILTNK